MQNCLKYIFFNKLLKKNEIIYAHYLATIGNTIFEIILMKALKMKEAYHDYMYIYQEIHLLKKSSFCMR